MYADDIALVAQANTLDTVEIILNLDLAYNLLPSTNYLKKWYVTLNLNKTMALALRLNNNWFMFNTFP